MTERDERPLTQTGGTSRRSVLLGAGAVGAAGLLAACGDDITPTTSNPTTPPATGAPTEPPATQPPPTTEPPTGSGSDIKAADIPVGGGKIIDTQGVVVTQPKAGSFKAFESSCTHQGCQVSSVSDGTINCACHGSKFKIDDGSVVNGPATRPLSAKTATVSGGTITVA